MLFFSSALARSCLSFFSWLFVLDRTGADPTRLTPGGGESALETLSASVMTETVSEMRSLTGVPGMSSEMTLPCREGCLLPAGVGRLIGVDAFSSVIAGTSGGVSVLGVVVASTRIVLGAVVRLTGVSATLVLGVAGLEIVDGVPVMSREGGCEGVPGLLIGTEGVGLCFSIVALELASSSFTAVRSTLALSWFRSVICT